MNIKIPISDALRNGEELFEKAFQNSPIGMALISPEGTWLMVNASICSIVGYPESELLNKTFQDITHPDDLDAELNYVHQMLSGEISTHTMEKRYYHKEGSIVWVLLAVALIKDDAGVPLYFISQIQDITKNKSAELHSDRQLLFTKALNEIAEVIIFEDNPEDILESANRIIGETLKLDRALIYDISFMDNHITGLCEWLSQNHPDIAPTKDRYPLEMFLTPFTEIKRTRKFLESHSDAVNKHFIEDGSGKILHEQMKIKSLIWYPFAFDEHGYYVFTLNQIMGKRLWAQDEIGFLESVAKQISMALIKIKLLKERKLAEAEKNRLELRLGKSQKMEAMGQLAGGISHDFNNLLTVINGYSQMLLMNPKLPDNIRQSIEAIEQSGEQAAGLTRQLLMFSRHHPIEPKVVNLNSIVSGMEKMLHRLIRENVIITINIAPNLWQIKADAGSIEQVIMNLVVNASDAMPDGGRLTVEVENVNIDGLGSLAHLQDVTPGLYVMLSVSDTGCGMDDKVREHIFEPFFTTKEIGKGTGLGLATVYGIIKQSNAHIDVQSEPGKGAVFQLYFPKIKSECNTDENMNEVTSFPGGTETILITEDEDNIRLMLKDFLQSIGYTVLTACNGKEALELAESHKGKIHLLLTDIVMPGMNGFELAKHLRDSYPEIELLFMSGYAKPTDTHKMMDITDNLIDKPIAIHALAVKLRKILGK